MIKIPQTSLLEAVLLGGLSERAINRHYNEEDAATLLALYQEAFPAAYIEEFNPTQAVTDIGLLKITDKSPIDLYLYKQRDQVLKDKNFPCKLSLSSTLLFIW